MAIMEYVVILMRLTKSRHDTNAQDYQSGLDFAQRLDRFSLVLFPISLILFIIIYMLYYGVYSRSVDILADREKKEL